MTAMKPGDNMRTVLADISIAAATAGISRDVLIAKMKEFADDPSDAQVKELQRAVTLGYIAGRIALASGKDAATASEIGAAAILLTKAGAGAAKANKAGIRTADEERMAGGARVFWHSLMVKADIAPEAGTGKGRAAGGKASVVAKAAKKKAKVTATVGAADVTISNAKAPAPPQAQPASAQPVTPIEAMAHVHSVGAALMMYLEANAAHFLPATLAKANKACAALRALPVPTH